MSCESCCVCTHEPPPNVTDEEVAWAERLAGILGNRPSYGRRNGPRPLISLTTRAQGIDRLDGIGNFRANVKRGRWADDDERGRFDHEAIAVSLEFYGLPPEVAEVILGALAISQEQVLAKRDKKAKARPLYRVKKKIKVRP